MSKKAFWVLGFFLWSADILAQGRGDMEEEDGAEQQENAGRQPGSKKRGPRGQDWGVVGGKTLGGGSFAIEGGMEGAFAYLGSIANRSYEDDRIGFRAGFSYGLFSGLDLGLRFTFNLGWGEIQDYYRGYTYVRTTPTDTVPGVKVQALLKVGFFDTGFLSLAMKVEPGFLADFYSGNTVMGLALPVGFQLGLALSRRVSLGILLDMPMVLEFGKQGRKDSFLLPILLGAGVDIFFTPNFLLHAALTMGPAINVVGSAWQSVHGGDVVFVAEVKSGISYRF
ncbi:MAG: hypothetical protein FWD46_01980 [Cystobacterineae bacterium]|nr:hypothetical protein [Cystobacterineae bacterium]